jgi:hypothetical protein
METYHPSVTRIGRSYFAQSLFGDEGPADTANSGHQRVNSLIVGSVGNRSNSATFIVRASSAEKEISLG